MSTVNPGPRDAPLPVLRDRRADIAFLCSGPPERSDTPALKAMPKLLPKDACASPQSIEEAYRGYSRHVARWARYLGGSDIDPEDVVQEVFLVVNRRMPSYRPQQSFAAWLFGITRKTVANHRRRQRRRLLRLLSQPLPNQPAAGLDPAAELERRQAVECFYESLDRLPEKYRTVLVLFEIERLSTLEIAELCGLKLSTVRVQLARARERFMRHYRRRIEADGSRALAEGPARPPNRPPAEPMYSGRGLS